MKIAILLLGLWAIIATSGRITVRSAVAPKPPAPPPPAPATTPAPPPPVAPADLVASKYKVSFKLANVEYADEMASYDSAVYQSYSSKIMTALMNLYADDNTYRDAQMIGLRNDSGVVADVSLRFGNESKNLASLVTVIATGNLGGSLPVDPASLKANKDESGPAVAGGFGCPSPCGAPTTCFPQCTQDCCGGSAAAAGAYVPQLNPPYGSQLPIGAGQQGGSQCPSASCPSSCAPSCEQSCCAGGAGGAGAGNPAGASPMVG